MPVEGLIFVRRRSPDWAAMARDFEAGKRIDPSRYAPSSEVPGFPEDIGACIDAWNDTFSMNFFRIRHQLKEISDGLLRQVTRATVLSDDRIDLALELMKACECLLFFFDDDDFFAPDTFERLAMLDPGGSDIAVFPLVRFGLDSFTFIRRNEIARVIVGSRRDFGHRFQTNNYGIMATVAPGHLPLLKDHVLGSIYADQQQLRDAYFDVIISATNKTPCSANTIGALLSNRQEYRAFIHRYVSNLRGLHIPPEVTWMIEPLEATLRLFEAI